MECWFGLIILVGLFFKLESWKGGLQLLILGTACLILLSAPDFLRVFQL